MLSSSKPNGLGPSPEPRGASAAGLGYPAPVDSRAQSSEPGLGNPPPNRLRLPQGFTASNGTPANTTPAVVDYNLDTDTLQQIVEGLDRLETEVSQRRITKAVELRGYLTPDEEERLRQLLLSYRNHRLAAYALICRHQDYVQRADEADQLRSFLLAFAAALTLYARSLRIIQVAEHNPVIRAKLNEPEPRCDLEPGFFDDVLAGYSSISNYRLIREADRFWRSHRRRIARLGFNTAPDTAWLCRRICRGRNLVRHRLLHVLWTRLRLDSRTFRETVFGAARQARHDLQAYVGTTFAQTRITPGAAAAIHDGVLASLQALLQPGDILLMRTEGRLTTALLPGFWAHAALYLGQLADLEALGLVPTPAVRSAMLSRPARFGFALEGVAPRVWINPLEACLVADHVLVLRPGGSDADRAAAIETALAHLGRPYDFEFDFTQAARVVCTAVVYRAWHGRGCVRFELVRRLGRFTLTGDDIAGQALAAWREAPDPAAAPLRWVAMVLHRRRDGAQFVSPPRIPTLLGRLLRGWRPLRRAPRTPAQLT